MVLFCNLTAVNRAQDAKPAAMEPKLQTEVVATKVLATDDRGSDGQLVALFSETASPVPAKGLGRELDYFYLYFPRDVSAKTSFAELCGSGASEGDALPLGSGQGDRKLLACYMTPEKKIVSVTCESRQHYCGYIGGLHDYDHTLVDYQFFQRAAPAKPLKASIQGSLSHDDLTVDLTGEKDNYHLCFSAKNHRWEFFDPPLSTGKVQKPKAILAPMKISVAFSNKAEVVSDSYHELFGLLAEVPETKPKPHRRLTLSIFVYPHCSLSLQEVCTIEDTDDQPVGAKVPARFSTPMHARIAVEADGSYKSLQLRYGQEEHMFVWDRDNGRWNVAKLEK